MAKKTSPPKASTTKKTPAEPAVDLSCGRHKSDCSRSGWACAGIDANRCSSFACDKHAIVGTGKPYVGMHICRVCAKFQQPVAA